MEKQTKLTQEIKIIGAKEELPEPEIQVIRNTYLSAMGLIKEEVIKKTWIIPVKSL